VADLLPLFPLGTVLFPGRLLPLQVFEPRYRTLMADVMTEPAPWSFGIVAIREGHEVGAASVKSLYDVGCIALIQQVEQLPDGRFAMVVAGAERFRIDELDESRSYLRSRVSLLDESSGEVGDVAGLADTVRRAFVDYRTTLGGPEPVELPDDPGELSYLVAATMVISMPERQQLLEAPDSPERLRIESALLSRELGLMRALHTVPITPPRLPPPSQN
jgi:uncharacterized protein